MIRSVKFMQSLAFALVLGATVAYAQVRGIPAEAKRGLMRHLQDMTVEIDGRAIRLAPGTQIRDANNMITLPAAVPAGSLIKFTLDAQGNVGRIWILSAEEAAQPDPRR